MSTPQWFLYSKDYLFFFFSSDGTSMSVLAVKSSRYPFCVSSFLCWDSSSASAWQTEEGEIETFTWKVFNGPRLGTPRVTLAWILLASAQSPGHRASRQAGKCSLIVPSRGRKGCGGHLVSLFAGRHCICGPRTCKSVAHEVNNE